MPSTSSRPPPPPGAALHLDLSGGARAEALIGALLDLGMDANPARAALDSLGLHDIEVTTVRVPHGTRGGLRHQGVDLLGLRALDVALVPRVLEGGAQGGPRPLGHGAERRRLPHAHMRVDDDPTPPVRNDDAQVARAGSTEVRALANKETQALAAGRKRRSRPKRTPLSEWLDAGEDELVRVRVALDIVRSASLAPITSALSLRALRHLLDALAESRGLEPGRTSAHDLRVPARALAVHVAAAVVACALFEQLAPAAVTMGAVTLPAEPMHDAEVRALCAGLPCTADDVLWAASRGIDVVAREVTWPATTPLALCILAAWQPRAAPPGGGRAVRVLGIGRGLLALDIHGHRAGARALLTTPARIPARPSDVQAPTPAVVLDATLPEDASLAALVEVARRSGCTRVSRTLVQTAWLTDADATRMGARVQLVLPEASLDVVTQALWRAGAADVVATAATRATPVVVDTRVGIGSAQRGVSVRVRAVLEGGVVLRLDADVVDVRAAALRTHRTEASVAAEAIAAWETLHPQAPHGTILRDDGEKFGATGERAHALTPEGDPVGEADPDA